MALVSSGALQTLLKVGLDLLMTLVFYVALPMLLATLDIIICIINFIQPGTWPEQLKCGTLALPLEPCPAHKHTTRH